MSGRDVPYDLLGIELDRVVVRVSQGQRADAFVRALLSSRTQAGRAFDRKQVQRDGMPLRQTDQVQAGEVVDLRLMAQDDRGAQSQGPVTVVWQDRLLLAADKPAGLLVHGDGTGAETLTGRVRGLLARHGLPAFAQPVQRLDVETTGLTLFSLTQEFQPALDQQIAGHDMGKRYLAVVTGNPGGFHAGWRVFRGPIGRDRHDARRMRVASSGKPSLTKARVIASHGGRSLLLVELATGRRHQIRVHLADAGMPIVGDALYGGSSCRQGLMLHAFEETLAHPLTGERLKLRTAWPVRFADLGFPEQPISAGE